MKKTNLYYKSIFQRKGVAKDYVIIWALLLSSWPKALVEAFFRKRFGERYFSLFTVIVLTFVLFFVPFIIDKVSSAVFGQEYSKWEVILKNSTWYIYLVALLYFSLERQKEIDREPGTFDFAKFSAYEGDIHPFFEGFKIKGKPVTRRQISILIEPAAILCVGIALALLQQKLGWLLIFCGLCYSVSNYGAYVRGDHFILDTIDEMIMNEEMVASFVDGRKPEETRGFTMNCGIPENMEFRKRVVEQLIVEDDLSEAY